MLYTRITAGTVTAVRGITLHHPLTLNLNFVIVKNIRFFMLFPAMPHYFRLIAMLVLLACCIVLL